MLLTRRRLLWPRASPEVWPGLRVRRRSEWTDTQPSSPLEAEEVRFLLVHHTAGNTQHGEADVPGILQGIRSFHVGQRGWPDIAYNFLVDRYGEVWEGRSGSLNGPVRGDATGGNQGFSQLVCLIGDFTSEAPTEVAQQALTLTLAWLADLYGIDTRPEASVEFTSRGSNRWPEGTMVTTTPIAGHRDMSHTSCPGDAFYPLLAERIGPTVHQVTQPPADGTTSTTPSSTTTTTYTTSSTTTTTSPPATSSTVPRTTIAAAPTTSAAAETVTGRSGLGFALLSVGAGAVVALLGWRARRMSRHG